MCAASCLEGGWQGKNYPLLRRKFPSWHYRVRREDPVDTVPGLSALT
jgi:hypothetical protein